MDKNATELLKNAKIVIGSQNDQIKKQGEELSSLRRFKLAFDITAGLIAKDQVDPADFQERVLELSEKKAEDLLKKAELLSIESPDLELGTLDERDKIATGVSSMDTNGSSKSPTPHSLESTAIARSLFASD